MNKRLAIVPARGGSKRIPNKNVREFCGKPMIAYILNAARASGLFDVIHVSTDSQAIRAVISGLGFEPDFPRPDELADDHTPIMPVLKYVAGEYARRGRTFTQVWLLMACSPLIDSKDLVEAEKLFIQAGGHEPLLAISEYQAPIEWAFCRQEDGRLKPVQPGMFTVRSQDLEKKYFDAGTFVAYPADLVLGAEGAGSDTGFIGKILPKYKAIDIDTPEDWALAEAVYRGMRQSVES